jgi:hypothetical protein
VKRLRGGPDEAAIAGTRSTGRWRIDTQLRGVDGGVRAWREVVTLPVHRDGPLEGRWVEAAFHIVLAAAADDGNIVRVRLLDLRGGTVDGNPTVGPGAAGVPSRLACLYVWCSGERPSPRLHPGCIVWDEGARSSVSRHGARVPASRGSGNRGDDVQRGGVLQTAAAKCRTLWGDSSAEVGRDPAAANMAATTAAAADPAVVEPPPAFTVWLEEYPAPPHISQRGFRWAPASCEAMRFAGTCPAPVLTRLPASFGNEWRRGCTIM